MDGIGKDIFTSVGSGVTLAILGWLWLKFSGPGQLAWMTLGQTKGLRSVAVIAAFALVLGLGALIAFVVRSRGVSEFQQVSYVIHPPVRIGPGGVEGLQTKYPGEYNNTDGWQSVTSSADYQICTINSVYVDSARIAGNPVESCELYHEKEGEPWIIKAVGAMHCRVSCFKLQSQ